MSERQLAAIMFTDIVGYSALTQRDEALAIELLELHRNLLRPVVTEFGGREIKTIGDAFLIEFPSDLKAVQAGLAMQQALADYDAGVEPQRRIQIRIGVHAGDVVRRDGDVYGDGVNIAARIVPLSPRGGIAISAPIYLGVRNKVETTFYSLGDKRLKNITHPVAVYVNRRPGPFERSPAWLRVVAAAVVIVGAGYFAAARLVPTPERVPESGVRAPKQEQGESRSGYYGDRSIAVLPFENLSADPEQVYFVDGVAEELLNLLARIRPLRVISRSSSFAMRDLDLDAPAIAQRLDVAHLLEGSVRKIGNTVRVTVQLIDARNDTHLWSKTYEREFQNVFAMQDEIAADVVRNLRIELLHRLPGSRRIHPEAVALTQQARQLFQHRTRSADSAEQMRLLIDRAIEIDPAYVSAWEWKVSVDFLLLKAGSITAEEEQRRYMESRRRIQELDPENGLIDGFEGIDAMIAGRHEEAAAAFERSLSRDPTNSNFVRMAGRFATEIGRFETAIRLGRHAVAIDPLCYQCLYQLSRTYLYAGDYEAAIAKRNQYLALSEGGGRYDYGLMLLLQGKAAEALEQFQSLEQDAMRLAGLTMAYHDLGDHARADNYLATLMETDDDDDVTAAVANAAAWIDAKDIAFDWLNRLTAKAHLEGLSLMSPVFRNLHDDPRWESLLASRGLAPSRLAAIRFEPVLPE